MIQMFDDTPTEILHIAVSLGFEPTSEQCKSIAEKLGPQSMQAEWVINALLDLGLRPKNATSKPKSKRGTAA
jgi:hypothetical protein